MYKFNNHLIILIWIFQRLGELTIGTLRKHDAADDGDLTAERGLGNNTGVRAKIIYIKKKRDANVKKVFLLFTYMASFNETRDLLLISRDENLIDDEEFYCCGTCIRLGIRLSLRVLSAILIWRAKWSRKQNEAECKKQFLIWEARYTASIWCTRSPWNFQMLPRNFMQWTWGLCIILRRFAYPCRYYDLIPIFGRPVAELCMIANQVTDFIYDLHGPRISQWNHVLLQPEKLQHYADTIVSKGAALQNCFGFGDGTVRAICRPGRQQRLVYNGHKRVHAIKFQCVALPNGMIANLFGPINNVVCCKFLILINIM